jgi:hypothetical protein
MTDYSAAKFVPANGLRVTGHPKQATQGRVKTGH